MPYDPDVHHRRSIRLQEYDYSQEGFYFITVCVHGRIPLFGEIVDEVMRLNDAGRMVEREYFQLSEKYPYIVCHEHAVMPNHFHCIIQITEDSTIYPNVGVPLVGAQNSVMNTSQQDTSGHPQGVPLRHTLGAIIGTFKSMTTNEYIRGVKKHGWKPFQTRLWQRNYYEHIIRDQRSYEEISCYIVENPIHWCDDKLYCEP